MSWYIGDPARLYFDETLNKDEELLRVEWLKKIYLHREPIGSNLRSTYRKGHALDRARKTRHIVFGSEQTGFTTWTSVGL